MNLSDFIYHALQTVQWFAMLTLSLTLFRLKPAGRWRHNALLALALNTVTLAVKATSLSPYLSIVQLLLIAFAFFLFYRIRLDYACVIAVTGGIIVFVSVLAGNCALALALHDTFTDVMFHKIGMPLYFASAATLTLWTFFLAWTLKRLRLGFSFVTTSYRQSGPNMRLFGVPLTMFVAVNVMLPPGKTQTYTPMLVIAVCLCLLMLLLASLRTEYEDDAQFGRKTGD